MIAKKEKRTEILYCRSIKKANKDWVTKHAENLGYSLAEYMDMLIEAEWDKVKINAKKQREKKRQAS